MFQVYTGDGKGKTTAAFGLALRAAGHGWRVLVIQFMKGDPEYGEVIAAKYVPGLEVRQFGLPTFVERGNPSAEDLRLAAEGLAAARAALSVRSHRLVILDEMNVAVDYGLVRLEDALALVEECPEGVELVFTGRGAKRQVLERADLVSDIKCVRHPFEKGVLSRAGIEH